MKCLLITLRHPGPAHAMSAVIPELSRYYRIVIAAGNSGLQYLLERAKNVLALAKVFYLWNGEWRRCMGGAELPSDQTEFESPDEANFEHLKDKLAELMVRESVDRVLRTTPTLKWGLDEAAADACRRTGKKIECRCYQEDYGCGNGLEQLTQPIAVVDAAAGLLLQKRAIKYIVVGWLSQSMFQAYRPYYATRNDTRNQLGLETRDCAVLYCMGASGAFEHECEHFRLFLDAIRGEQAFYRFHPRNTPIERERLGQMACRKAQELPAGIPYEGALSFSDYLISAASAMNQDALQYQIESEEQVLQTISIYTKGFFTAQILMAATGERSLPHTCPGMGSKLVNEHSLMDFRVTDRERAEYYRESAARFGMPAQERMERFVKYIEGAE